MQFSVLTLNLRHGQGQARKVVEASWTFGAKRPTMRENASRIGEFIARQNPAPDIVCLQETNAAAFFWPDILSIVQIKADYPYVAAATKGILPHNNAILSRLAITRIVSQQFSALLALRWGPKAFFYSANRGFMAAEVEGVGWVVNTHLDPYHEALRISEAREMRSMFNRLGSPAVIAGDLNPDRHDDQSLRTIGEGFETSPQLDAENFSAFATWPAGGQLMPERRLDYLFVSPPLRVVSTLRLSTGCSDHLGVLASVESP